MGERKLKKAPGIIPAVDVPLGRAVLLLDELKELKDEITAAKLGYKVSDDVGKLVAKTVLRDHAGIDLPFILDYQKACTDVPHVIENQVRDWASYDMFDAIIGDPLGAGSHREKKGALEAFVETCYECNVIPIVVIEKTSPGATRYSSLEKCEELARDARDLGVNYVVAPATRPERIEVYKRIGDFEVISPGVGPQKTGNVIEDAKNAVRHGADHLVIGRGIFNAANPKEMTKKIYEALLEAYG